MSEEKKIDVKFLTSLALAVPTEDEVKHIQLTLVQVVDTKEIRCYMDVIDAKKLPRFVEDESEMSKSDSAS